jgi:hypothetical protein
MADVEGLQELSSTILARKISLLSLRSEMEALQTSNSLALASNFSFSILRLAREIFNSSILASKSTLSFLRLGIETSQTFDSPVNYSGAPSDFPEGSKFSVECPSAPDTVRWCSRHCPVAHRTVRCARPRCLWVAFCSLCLNPFLFFLLTYCEPLAPVELID